MRAADSVSGAHPGKIGTASKNGAAARPAQDDCPRLPNPDTLTALTAPPHNERVRGFMARLVQTAPQTLLLEGGTVMERAAFSLYWACLLNCENRGLTPCFACDSCRRFLEERHHDFFLFDGREQSIKIDDLRAVRATLGEPPRHARTRVVLLLEAQSMGNEAANSQLKILEEPRPGTCFILTAPQRERLLPTLVSRSWVLTLAWPQPGSQETDNSNIENWKEILQNFLRTGRGLFSHTSIKGALDKNTVARLVTDLQRQLAQAILGGIATEHIFSELDLHALRRLDETLNHCLESLEASVNPALCLEWLATRLHTGFQGRKGG